MKEKILKLAKRLKTFTLSEIELISDIECEPIIKELIKDGNIKVLNNHYEYLEPIKECYKIVHFKEPAQIEITISKAVKIFIKCYAEKNCKKWTIKTYISIFNTNILPYFKNTLLNELDLDAVIDYYEWLKNKRLSAQRTKIQWHSSTNFCIIFKNKD